MGDREVAGGVALVAREVELAGVELEGAPDAEEEDAEGAEPEEDGPAELEGSWPTQLVSEPVRIGKSADWATRPLESRRSRPADEPGGKLTTQRIGSSFGSSPKS